jgi:RNA polymerase sigma-70 factor, ECF subfamily
MSAETEPIRFHRRLVQRMGGGDAEALRMFYGLYADRVHGVVLRIVGNPEDARDAVQETFVKAWRQARTYREDRGEVFAWLVLIARNTAIDHVRAGTRRREILAEFSQEPPPCEPAGSGVVEQRDFLRRTLGQLEHSQRRALELAFFAGRSQAEVAQDLEVPVSTVKNLLHRGLLRLRELARRHE